MGRAKRHIPKRLAEKLLMIREQSGLSMSELVEKLVSKDIPLYKADISKFEAGLREPPLVILLRYSRLGKTSIESLIDDDLNVDL